MHFKSWHGMQFVYESSIKLKLFAMNNPSLDSQICAHKSSLDLFARKFTNDLEDANDLVQDTMIKAIRYANMYKEGTNLRGWLYTIMRNTFINDYRRKSMRNGFLETSEELS